MRIGNIVKLNQDYLNHYYSKTATKQRQNAESWEFKVLEFLPDSLVKVHRLGKPKVGYYHSETIWKGFLTLSDTAEEQTERIAKLANAWCQWNRKEITGDDFASLFRKLYMEETSTEWNRARS